MTIYGTSQSDTISIQYISPGVLASPTDAADLIYGMEGDDLIEAAGGNDTLDGGDGTDSLFGADGDDVYLIADHVDRVMEFENEGHDRVDAWVNYALTSEVEDLSLIEGSAAIVGYGNGLDNTIFGNGSDNALHGGDGADWLVGRLGDDTLAGGYSADTLEGGEGHDRLLGGDGMDSITGGAGDDMILGGASQQFSGIVSPLSSVGAMPAWLADPQQSRIEAQVRFAADLPADVVFGVDQELAEGVDDPIRFAGANWMALTGVDRDGRLVEPGRTQILPPDPFGQDGPVQGGRRFAGERRRGAQGSARLGGA